MRKRSNLLRHSAELLQLSGPILLAHVTLLCSGIADAAMAGNYGTQALAAVGIGSSLWGTVFASFFGIIQGLSPIIGRKFGADETSQIGAWVRASTWLAVVLGAAGAVILALVAQPIFRFARVPEEVLSAALDYVSIVAMALPAALLMRVFYALTSAIKRPKPIVWINACALLVKVPLSFVLMHGLAGAPALGLAGCAYGTVAMFVFMALMSGVWLLVDPCYRQLGLRFRPAGADWRRACRVLALGVPIGISYLLEIGSLTVMAFIIARLGALTTAAHQILASLTGLMFMSPMALGVGAQTLIANAIGRGDRAAARDIAGTTICLSIVWGLAAAASLLGAASLVLRAYTSDLEVTEMALSLMPIFVLYVVFDAIQIVAASALRGYEQTLVPSLVYLVSLWGVGVLGGHVLTHGIALTVDWAPAIPALGLQGVWLAGTASLFTCALGLGYLLEVRSRS
ncbi:Na(+)/drug antiporter [Variovorax sp. WDL1]|uniref:MATE family efflux transporter n=1 Tax=Variovorax sp. WDL1 TaxID=207745 RepID=UPI00076DEDE6|nr:MATE family efflux transporter [Variovorax sp. WDL1]KWT73895.1 Na+-driven multidrug efflux pump [Variovorax sp. WDL1]PNG52241.1 Multidrug resistance protein NorM [Variovorax sp. B4]PNG54781.1 Multidrug resistance protein NorM [Variovorax sp. B2]VTV15781.1 Na(+)/drug antiporter [Variovorax sp. WDL1]